MNPNILIYALNEFKVTYFTKLYSNYIFSTIKFQELVVLLHGLLGYIWLLGTLVNSS